jgi:hypothetical protein
VSSESSSGDVDVSGVYRSRPDDSAKLVCDQRRFGDLRPFKRPYLPPQISLSQAASFTKIQINPRLGLASRPRVKTGRRFLVSEKSRMGDVHGDVRLWILRERPLTPRSLLNGHRLEASEPIDFRTLDLPSPAPHLARSIEIRFLAAIEKHI